MSKQLILEVVESFHGFYLYHNPSGRCRGMGDGVDTELYNKRLDVVTQVGEEGFAEAWQDEVDESQCEYMEAYFYDLWALEVYQHNDTLFVVTGATPGYPKLVDGLYLRPSAPWQYGEVDTALLAPHYKPVSYMDLSFDEQQAIAEALKEAKQ